MIVGELVAKLAADTGSFDRSMKDSSRRLDDFVTGSKDAAKASQRFDESVGRSRDSLGRFIKSTESGHRELSQLSEKTDVTHRRLGLFGDKLQRGASATEQLGSKSRSAAQDLDKIENEAKQASDAIAGSGGSSLVGSVGKFVAGAAAMFGGFQVFQFAKEAIFGFNSQLQAAEMAFTSMLGSGEKAKAFMDDLKDFAVKTPFEFTDLVAASQKMTALGFAAEDILPALTAVGDATAAMGGSKDVMEGIIRAMGQIKMKGKVQAEEMNQLAERGIPGWEMLADKIGVEIPEAMEMAKKGAIDANTATAALLEGLKSRYGGLMSEQSKTFAGAMSNIKDSALQLVGGAFKPLFEAVTEIGLAFADLMNNPKVKEWGEKLGASIRGIVTGFINLAKGIGDAVKRMPILKDLILAAAAATAVFVAWWVGGKVISGISAAIGMVKKLGAALVTAFTAHPVLALVALIVGGLVIAYRKVEWFRDGVDKAFGAIKDIMGNLGDAWGEFVTGLTTGTSSVKREASGLESFFGQVGARLSGLYDGVKKAIDFAKDAWSAFTGGLSGDAEKVRTSPAMKWLEGLGRTVGEQFEKLKGIFHNVWSTMRNGWSTFVESFKTGRSDIKGTGITGFFEGLGSVARTIFDGLKAGWKAAGDAFSAVVAGIRGDADSIKNSGLSDFFYGVGEIVRDIADKVGEFFKSAAEGVGAFVTGFKEGKDTLENSGLADFFEGVGEKLRTGFDKVGPVLAEVAEGVEALVTAFINGQNEIENSGFADKMEEVGTKLRDVWDSIVDSIKPVVDWIDRVAEPIGGIGAVVAILATALLALVNPIAGVVAGIATLVAYGPQIMDTLKPAIEWLTDAWNTVYEAMAPLVSAVNDFLEPIGGLASVFSFLGAAILFIINPIAGVIAAIGALVVFGPRILDALQPVFDFFAGVWDTIKKPLGEFVGFFVERWDEIKEAMSRIASMVGAIIRAGFIVPLALLRGAIEVIQWVWNSAGESIMAALGNLWDFVRQAIDSIVGIFGGLFDIILGIINLDWDRIKEGIGRVAGSIWDLIWSLVTNVGKLLGNLLSIVGNLFVDLVGLVWKGIQKLPGIVWNGLKKVVGFFAELPGKILGFVGGLVGKLAEWGLNLLSGLAGALWDGANAMWDFWTSLPGKIWDFISALPGRMWEFGLSVIDSLSNAIFNGAVALWNWFTELPSKIGDFFRGAANWLFGKGGDVIDGAKNGIADKWSAIVEWFTALPGRIVAFFTKAKDWIFGPGKEMIAGFLRGIGEKFLAVGRWFLDLPGNIWSWMKDAKEWLVTKGRDIMRGLLKGVIEKVESFKKWIRDLPGNILKWLGNAKDWLLEKGRDLLEGLWNGINRAGDWFKDKFLDLIRAIVPDALEGLLQIRSPSKVMAEKGRYIMEGLAQGISGNAHLVEGATTAIGNTVQGMMDNLSQKNWGADLIGGDVANGLSVVGDSLKKNKELTDRLTQSAQAGGFNLGNKSLLGPAATQSYFNNNSAAGGSYGMSDNGLSADRIGTIVGDAIRKAQGLGNSGAPIIGTQNFYGMDPRKSAREMTISAKKVSYLFPEVVGGSSSGNGRYVL